MNCGMIIFREMKISRFDLFRANHNRPDVALNLAPSKEANRRLSQRSNYEYSISFSSKNRSRNPGKFWRAAFCIKSFNAYWYLTGWYLKTLGLLNPFEKSDQIVVHLEFDENNWAKRSLKRQNLDISQIEILEILTRSLS